MFLIYFFFHILPPIFSRLALVLPSLHLCHFTFFIFFFHLPPLLLLSSYLPSLHFFSIPVKFFLTSLFCSISCFCLLSPFTSLTASYLIHQDLHRHPSPAPLPLLISSDKCLFFFFFLFIFLRRKYFIFLSLLRNLETVNVFFFSVALKLLKNVLFSA